MDELDKVEKFRRISDMSELANFFNALSSWNLGLTQHKMWRLTFLDNANYKTYSINKKDGTERIIRAPQSELREVQRIVLGILDEMYKPKKAAHGFTRNKSIVTNAKQHVRMNLVLNFDILDFFPSITVGRIVAVFKYYFKFNDFLSGTLASLLTYQGQLPQGAPTSPFLSNVVMSRFDSRIRKISEKYKFRFSRYADDITFSTSKKRFDSKIFVEEENELGSLIKEALSDEGMVLNDRKTRLMHRYDRQDVTGLIVNTKVNVNRRYIRNVRAAVYNFSHGEYEDSVRKLFANHVPRHGKYGADPQYILFGMISYIRSVRGDDELTYSLAKQYNDILYFTKKFDLTEWDWEKVGSYRAY
ncbi:reverse transcriptase domain-containing protein [Weissella cibaria]